MDVEGELAGLRGVALQALVDQLLLVFDVGRCTLRLQAGREPFAVAYEARRPQVRSLIDDREVSLTGQPVVEAVRAGRQVVQHDSRTAYDDPSFQRMLDSYGDMGAQIVTPVVIDGAVHGIVSLHHLGGPRRWSEGETTLATGAAVVVAGVLQQPVGERR